MGVGSTLGGLSKAAGLGIGAAGGPAGLALEAALRLTFGAIVKLTAEIKKIKT